MDFQPVEILFIRFMMGFLALLAVCLAACRASHGGRRIVCLAGLCGVCLYYLLENIALTYTMASNVGSSSPCLLLHRPADPFSDAGRAAAAHIFRRLCGGMAGSALSASTALP